ncbi:unnamed protein product [Oppiella nova]|uniref:C3H1-type domain-containing protein n=1 Tax=Oppiella nova TaxID=334625 RepID=A0A7R9LYP3_9ACAR|nr:unnamed protein product [Oppiella nova]CAG2168199.1 unnamed protein product [Oppiella nova]
MSHNTINANTNRYNNNRLHNNNNSYHNMSNKLALVKRSRFTLKRLAAARRSTTTATNGQAVGPKAPVVEMPVCQYYLEGRCSNDDCPYRHVNVNANARVCQLYLQGHCPLGDKVYPLLFPARPPIPVVFVILSATVPPRTLFSRPPVPHTCVRVSQCKSSHRFVGKSNAKNKFITKLIKRAKLGPKTGAKPATQHQTNGASHRQHRHHHYHRRSLSNSIHVDLQCQTAGADHSLPPYIPISADTTDTSDREAIMFATNSNECNELVVNSNQSHRVLTNRRQKYFWLESDDECSGDEDRDVSMRPDSVTARCRPSIRVVPNFML